MDDPAAPPVRAAGRPGRAARARAEGKRDVVWEEHLRAIAFWPRVSSLLGLVGVVLLAGYALSEGVARSGRALAALGVLVLPALLLLAGVYAVGHYLHRYHPAARIVQMVLTGVGLASGLLDVVAQPRIVLLALPGLAWTGAIFFVLLNARAARICSDDYRELVRCTPAVRVSWWASPFFWIPAVLMALGFVASFALLFVGIAHH
jgi:hypothetical protein